MNNRKFFQKVRIAIDSLSQFVFRKLETPNEHANQLPSATFVRSGLLYDFFYLLIVTSYVFLH